MDSFTLVSASLPLITSIKHSSAICSHALSEYCTGLRNLTHPNGGQLRAASGQRSPGTEALSPSALAELKFANSHVSMTENSFLVKSSVAKPVSGQNYSLGGGPRGEELISCV